MDHHDIKVLYEDNHVLVAVKPQGVPSQSDVSGDGDMLSLMKEHVKEKYSKPGNVYLGLVHRPEREARAAHALADERSFGQYRARRSHDDGGREESGARL